LKPAGGCIYQAYLLLYRKRAYYEWGYALLISHLKKIRNKS
jgi:hypothetical protein